MNSLKSKFILAVCIICLCCLSLTEVISYTTAKSAIMIKESENAKLTSECCSEQINSWLEKQSQMVENIGAGIEAEGNMDYEYMCNYLKNIFNNNNKDGYIFDLYFTNTDNKMASGSGYEPEETIDFTQRDWYKGALDTEGIYYATPYLDTDSKKVVITMSKKIIINGELAGVLAEDIFVDTLINIVNKVQVPENSYMMMLDNNNGVVVHPNENYGFVDDEPVAIDKLQGNPYKELNSNQEKTSLIKDYDGRTRSFFESSVKTCGWKIFMALDKDVMSKEANSMLPKFLISIIISLIFGILVIYVMIRKMLLPIENLAVAVENGDVANDIQIDRNDEIGKLQKGFNMMIHNLRALLKISREAVGNIGESSLELEKTIKSVVEGSLTVDDKMNAIINIMNAQYSEVNEGINKIESFEQQIDFLENNFVEMESIIIEINKDLGDNIKSAAALRDTTSRTINNMENVFLEVKQLEDKSKKINEIVATINDISEQTNLLSLNASIEAARAGEAGKGFAIVAEEIRALSEQTKKSSKNISELISDIERNIIETANSIKESKQAYEDNLKNTNNVENAIDKIQKSISEFKNINIHLMKSLGSFSESKDIIKSSFEKISENTSECMETTEETKQISENQTKTVRHLNTRSDELKELAVNLNEKTNIFKI